MIKTLEGVLELESNEDSGASRVLRLDDPVEEELFIRVQSWDQTKQHSDLKCFEGKKVRITIQIIE